MIRRDYILRMLAEFFEVLSRIRAFQKGELWEQARQLTDEEFRKLVGTGASELVRLSQTGLLALVIKGETTLAVREKALILATLFKEAGDTAAGKDHPDESRLYYVKGLELLLDILTREDVAEFPDFVPRVEIFLQALGDEELPLTTRGMLMQHYERVGEFGRAEDMLFSMLDDTPDSPELLGFGIAFYERIRGQSDDALTGGNLPRAELESGLAQLVARKAAGAAAA